MKWYQRHVVIGLATTAFVFCLLVALLTSCGKHSAQYDDCDSLGLAAAEAPARPGPRPARPRKSLRKPAAPKPAVTHHVVVHHVVHPAPTHHVVVHHAHPTHHVVHHYHDDDLC